jgi:protein required for attachment to host cells
MPGMLESKTQQTSGAVTWVAVTDGERLRILEITDDNQSLQQVDVADLLASVREQVKVDDVVAAGPDSGGQQGEPGIVTDLFSTDYKRRMSACLERARQLGLYDRVVAIAPPAVLGSFVDRRP